ncbi:hypothetical protein ACWEOE_36930 [Amycolatopsis sp. NPDC004368]
MPDRGDLVEDEAAAAPVFVDATGRRRKLFRRAAIGGGVLTVGYVVVLVAALLGAPVPSPLLVPITQFGAGHTDVTTTPADPPDPSTTTDAPPTREAGTDPTSVRVGAPERSVTTTAAQPPATTATTVSGAEHRNSHAPDTPPGKADTSKKPRP